MSFLYTAPVAVISIVLIASLLGALELGFRLSRLAPVGDRQASTIATPVLALVGLLLAFSFSMVGERHAIRRAVIVENANSIRTFWLRTAMVPEPTRSEMQVRVRRYIELHLEHHEARIWEERTKAIQAEGTRLQKELWTLHVEEARRHPDAGTLRLVTDALNTMIDSSASALAARENRLPDAIFVYLFLMVVTAGFVAGYRPRGEKRNPVLWAVFTVVLSGMLMLLLDMDRPRRGLFQADVTPYERLRDRMREGPP